jgi:exonuclease VII large subunit
LNPLAVLKRGYAVVTRKKDGMMVSKVKQVNAGDGIQVRVSDGQFDAEIVDGKP